MKKSILIIVFILTSFIAISQEHENEHENFKHFRISPVISHTFIPTTTSEGDKTVIVPTIGLDLEYWINEKWGFGFHNDLELETFEIEKEHELFVEKEFPLVLTFDALYKFKEHWVFVVGTGVEFEKNEDLFILRAGLEYEVEFGNHWDVSPTVIYDHRSNSSSTWGIGIGIGKRF